MGFYWISLMQQDLPTQHWLDQRIKSGVFVGNYITSVVTTHDTNYI